MAATPIYLDNNATTAIDPQVVEAMDACYRQFPGNPASQHVAGRGARRVLEEAREEIAALLGATVGGSQPDQVIFTSGATEANNLAVRGLLGGWQAGATPAPHLVVSAIEHPSIGGLAEQLAAEEVAVSHLPVDSQGVVDLGELPSLLGPGTRLVCIMLGNNETGALQPVAEAAAICRATGLLQHGDTVGPPCRGGPSVRGEANQSSGGRSFGQAPKQGPFRQNGPTGVPLHCDAVQVAGKLRIDFAALGAATMSISAHKFHGPRGVGALVVRGGVALAPLLYGGFQQGALRPGSEPVALAVGMATALRLWHEEADVRAARMTALRDQFEALLLTGSPDLVIHARGAARLPHTSHVAFPGLDRQALLMALDLAGVACSAGSSCASGSSELSPTLLAMGVANELAAASLRFSVSAQTTAEEVAEAARRILNVCNNLRALQERGNPPPPSPVAAAKGV